ncbi:SIMPL domain-containing protein [Exiguobacterium sp. B2(2022)]|uniref:SIMPL domain-containing protein n=1 Tax=Exiguobacterium sp. B2(2022) TaxID=2992755 RepID=UPI00237A6AA0|nr:SIMPL domain-containing protein [Exiguobacterium sp. B2(2022)]MDE0563179.1 SIMPL domain-containing protein [Exiguobacterium sp. B2(2022)]
MERTITVKGTGNVSSRPDLIVIHMDLVTKAPRYEETMTEAANAVAQLQKAIVRAGFEKKDMKTSDFSIDTLYDQYRDKDKNYRSRLIGYACRQKMKVEFPLDTSKLSDAIEQISQCRANPLLSIRFTMKDPNAIEDQLLVNAAENAKKRAELLATGAGATLGELIQIDYTWSEIHLFSATDIRYGHEIDFSESRMPELEPDDINVSDSATFVWSLK